jgi:hypothetical protein
MSGFGRFIMAHRRAWLPPIIIMIIVFVLLVILSNGKTVLPFLYRFS